MNRGTATPVAYSSPAFTFGDSAAFRLSRSSRTVRYLAIILLVLLFGTTAAMLFAPWRQTVTGSGTVIAWAPDQRQQSIEAPVKGRITNWDPTVVFEGARVAKDQVLFEIRDLDPDYLDRLAQQKSALESELNASEAILEAYTDQTEAYRDAREQILLAADQYIEQAKQKIDAQKQKVTAATAANRQFQFDYERQKALLADGLASEAKFQLAEQKAAEAVAKLAEAEANLRAAESELEAKKNERSAKDREAITKIDSATASQQKAAGDIAKTQKMLAELATKISRQESQVIRAPMDGFVLQLVVRAGQIIKEGDPLLTLVPDTADRAVQITVNGNDAPLVTPGRHVRLQFEGWPAIQFSGWPSVAVGTFGGTVATVDANSDAKGNVRVLIIPDPESGDWPQDRYLRQGVRANGWVILDRVSLGYEVWRRLNGFPPVVSMDDDGKSKASKPPKVGK